jgi:hypothetical protein
MSVASVVDGSVGARCGVSCQRPWAKRSALASPWGSSVLSSTSCAPAAVARSRTTFRHRATSVRVSTSLRIGASQSPTGVNAGLTRAGLTPCRADDEWPTELAADRTVASPSRVPHWAAKCDAVAPGAREATRRTADRSAPCDK